MSPPRLSDVQLLDRLIAFDTTSRNSNLDMVDFLCDYAERPGVRIERNVSPDGLKANLVITVGERGRDDRDGLVLSGHMDVVPADEPEWDSDPFTLTERDGAYVARGSADMKGFLALAVNIAADLDPTALDHPLVLVFTYDEELGTLGAQHLVDTFPGTDRFPRNAVIGEPTSLRVVRAHKGHAKFQLRVFGKSAHSGLPHLGDNAIERTAIALRALSDLREKLQGDRDAYAAEFPEVPYPAMNVATIAGGTAINIIPDRCVVDIGVRTLPGITADTIEEQIRETLDGALSDVPFELERTGDSPPLISDPQADIYQTLTNTMDQTPGLGASFAADAGWFQTTGMDCVLFGPGDIGVAHRPNEFLPIAEFISANDVLKRLVHHYCSLDDAR